MKNQIIYVDFRDGDFLTSDGTSNTYTNKDVQIRYDLTLASFLQKSEINGWIWVDDGQVVGEWEEGRKPSGESRIPVTVKNSWGGGYGGAVKVDGSWVSSPWQVLWNMGSHSIEAATNQGAAWTFDHWSDGGARSHSVSATLSLFSAVYTAYYVASGQSVITPEESVLVYPNPFNPSATIVFATTTASIVRLSIFNALGQEIGVLVDEFKNPGRFEVTFDASALPTGMYYCTLRTQNGASTRRLLLLR